MVVKNGETTTLAKPVSPYGGARWTPLEEMEEMRRRFDDLFGNFLGAPRFFVPVPSEFEPDVDLYEYEDRFEVFAALPGYTIENINVDCVPEGIWIAGNRKPIVDEKATPRKPGRVATEANFSVRYSLPVEIDTTQVTATMLDGVLKVVMPKIEAVKEKKVHVEVLPK